MSEETKSSIESPPAKVEVSADSREAKLKVYDRILATVSALGLVIGGCWGLYTYSRATYGEAQHRKDELKRLIFNERKDVYLLLCDAVCDIVACRNRNEVEEKSRSFLKLYAGRAHIIAEPDSDVSKMKIAFKNRLMDYLEGEHKTSKTLPFHFFVNTALDLTDACRKNIDPRLYQATAL